jgi:sigma-B regulation protein RsbU (phosphoserine phosphatase)
VILQDLVMPGIDGLTLVEQFRASPFSREIPMIVLSSQEEAVTKAEAFARGANDYLVKLPEKVELIARIRYHSRAYLLLQERNAANAALADSQRVLAAELAEAAEYVRSLLPAPITGVVDVRWDFEASSSIGGDAFGYHWIDDDHFACYLFDVCGHGVGAALLSVSVMNTLSSGTLKKADPRNPEEVLAGLNDVFQMELHNNMYFTIWYGVFRRSSRELRYSCAGHPPALLFDSSQPQALPRRLSISALPIGCMESVAYESETVRLGPEGRLYLYSDGVYEFHVIDEREMSLDDLVVMITALPDSDAGIQEIRNTIGSRKGTMRFDDDFSLVELVFR